MINIENYNQQELTLDGSKVQLHSILYFTPFAVFFGLPYYLLWNANLTKANLKILLLDPEPWGLLATLLIIIIGVVVHELIHGVTWAFFAKKGYSSMTYGVLWKSLTPYCHCKEPLRVKDYIIGAIMPGILLGILPSLAAILTGHLGLFLFGLLFTFAASGDFMMVNLLRKVPLHFLVQDHPSKIGCYLYQAKPGLITDADKVTSVSSLNF